MVYGAILERGEKYYTYLSRVFDAIHNEQYKYNWLITDCVCYPCSQKISELLSKKYCWLSGNELTSIIEEEDFQWVWAVLSGFKKDISPQQVLEYPLPYSNCYPDFWKNPISIQHPLASVEIVPWDSGLVLFLSKHKEMVDDFMTGLPLSENLSLYNENEY